MGAALAAAAAQRAQRRDPRPRSKQHPGLLEELQDTVARQCAVSEPSYVPLERISRQRLFTAAMLVAVTYFLLPQLADLPGVVREIGAADWSWVPLVVLFSALTYVGAALGIGGAVPARLRAVPTLLAQVAASFASNLAPAGVGGMALNVRYLQKSGVDAPVAASSVGLNAVAGFAVHIGLMFVFFVWAGHVRARLDLPAELVGRRDRRRRRRGVRRGRASRSRSRAGCSRRGSCPCSAAR